MLHALRSTGRDPTGKYLNVLWLHNGVVSSGFKVDISGRNRWLMMLADTQRFATFAYITSACLVSGNEICRNPAGGVPDHMPIWKGDICLLDTEVYVREAKEPTLLEHERDYYFVLDNRGVWFQVRRGEEPGHPSDLLHLSHVASIPLSALARLRVFDMRNRRGRMLAENSWIGGKATRVRIGPGE